MRIKIYFILIVVSVLAFYTKGIAQKTDTIYHINGDILTGDFKKLVYGVVTWKMDGMGTISLEEPKINTIKSRKLFEIKMKNGYIYFCSLDTSNIPRKVNLVLANGRELVNISDIVEIYPIKRNFWMRTSGKFSLGASYSKGSDVGSIAFSGNINYRKRNSYFELAWDDNNTYQADTLSSSKYDVSLAWQRLLKKKWSIQVSVGAAQNSELGTKLRLDLNTIGIRDITYNNWNRFYAGAGLSLQRETAYSEGGSTEDLSGIITVVWKVFKYSIPKVWVDADVSLLPYLTAGGRYRAVFNVSPQVSIFNDDFKVGFKFYYNYDSSPPSEEASKFDYGINLELSYTFH